LPTKSFPAPLSTMIPYTVVFLIVWSIFLLIYWAIGIPLGLQAFYTYPPPM